MPLNHGLCSTRPSPAAAAAMANRLRHLSLLPAVSSSLLLFLLLSCCPTSLASAAVSSAPPPPSTFDARLDALQKRIGYKFKAVDTLRQAVTHPSYSRTNNRALSILGLDAARAAVSLRCLGADPDVTPGDLSRRVSADTEGGACAADGLRLGLQEVVRVARLTNASAPTVVCGAFRAVVGAVALDAGGVDASGDVFRRVHGQRIWGVSAT